MTLHTEEEWIELFKLKKGFCSQIVDSQEITAVCNKLESMQNEINELKAENKWVWENCTVIHWPFHKDSLGSYPIEHNMKARKDSKQMILAEMAKHKQEEE